MPALLLAWVVGGVDVVDASWPNELDLKDRLLVPSPSVMRMFCRILLVVVRKRLNPALLVGSGSARAQGPGLGTGLI